ncbi:unnamed protein product [Schistocephalus solidus]|uniref:Protein grainyhead n=1 Tax=Schistocephalus solidus TaxID=70667 RepID=A0A183SK17_SCHSO|nr:unnamed protein product [Schistocephalus solidus]
MLICKQVKYTPSSADLYPTLAHRQAAYAALRGAGCGADLNSDEGTGNSLFGRLSGSSSSSSSAYPAGDQSSVYYHQLQAHAATRQLLSDAALTAYSQGLSGMYASFVDYGEHILLKEGGG